MFSNEAYLVGGGLMSYGPNIAESFRLAAVYVDKILKGAKPADLPVEQPARAILTFTDPVELLRRRARSFVWFRLNRKRSRFDLVINLRAATALGLTMPESLLFQADRLIE